VIDILALGLDAVHERIERAPFGAAVSLAGRGLALLDPAGLPALWGHVAAGADGKYTTNAETDGGLGNSLIALLRRRRREVAELMAAGGTLVSYLRPVGSPLYIRRRSRRGPVAVIVHAYSWLPDEPAVAQLVIASAPGREPRAADTDHPAWQLLHAQDADAAWQAVLANEQLHPAWHVVATDRLGRPVALEVAVGRGRIVFVPPVVGDAERCGELLVQCFAPVAEEEPEPEPPAVTEPPDWLADHLLPGQAGLDDRLAELSGELERVQAELADVRACHEELAALSKLTYAATNPELADAVAAALRKLGFGVETDEDGCLLVASEEGNAVVAVAASAAVIESEPYWLLVRRFEDEAEPPAGIIVGNAWCEAPPDQREAPFSDLLRRGAEHRGLCLLPSTGLHAAMAALVARPDDEALRRSLRQAILAATGPCDLAPLLGA